jgi:hypothetical protein
MYQIRYGKKNSRKKTVLCIQKTFNAVFKNGLNPVFGSIPRLPTQTTQFLSIRNFNGI